MKDLSIIIKGGNKDKIYRTLYSIMCQSADWGKLKIIVHEASVPKSIKNIPLDYTVSETYRITTPFVMYFEAGDCFSANDSLWFIQRAIKENPEACTISTEFIEEAVNGNQASIQQFPNNTDAPYGKILSKRAAGKAGAENCEPVFVKQVTYIKRTEIEQKAIASPKLSIVIPYFKDDEKLLFRALASIETQSSINFHNIEVLVCIDTKGNTKVKRLIDKNHFSFKIDFFER
ncbi:hypothetical protein FWH09_01220 [Candidatus Saccharibacteria bacterium]|nr:hypothetical protein [Candidatus Saccharibacteria bacterium]